MKYKPLEINPKRRNFIVKLKKVLLGLFFFKLFPFKIVYGKSTIFKTVEILGIKDPELCGEYYSLRNEASESFREMAFEAQKEGLYLWCASGYRSFEYQKNLWNHKFKYYKEKQFGTDFEIVNEILKYSSLPGTSRHHWGTDLDIVDAYGHALNKTLKQENFEEGGEYQFLLYWLNINASKFGYFQAFTNDSARTGFQYEPWHYSYAPLAKQILPILLDIDFTKIPELKLCKGNQFFTKDFFQKYKEQYILGINKDLI